MADYTDILIGNLKETFKAIEKFLLVGFTASLALVVLAITDRGIQSALMTGLIMDHHILCWLGWHS